MSPDGLSFTKSISNPVMTGDGSGFDAYEVSLPVVLVEDGTWILYYVGCPVYSPWENGCQIGRATAPGPTGPWTRSATPVIPTGSPGEWDSGRIMSDSIVRTPDGYALYYWACPPSSYACRIGMATSTDGVNWTKYNDPATTYPPYAESDPVMYPGPGMWEGLLLYGPWARQTAAGWEMFYTGVSNEIVGAMGYATSADGVHWFKYAGNPVLDIQSNPWAVNRIAFPSGFISGTTTIVYYDDSWGASAIGRAAGGVCMPLAQAIFSWQPVTPTLGAAITFTAAAAGTDPVAFAWDLGDGITATGRVVNHTYAAPGAYTVTLTATNCQTGTATAVHVVTVQPPCVPVEGADFSWEPLTPAAGAVVTFSGTVAAGDEPIAYAWDFGDSSGTGGPAAVVTHTYGSPGVYTVVMTASNCLTATATAAHTVTVTCPDVTGADFSWTPDPPAAQQVVTFTAAAEGPRPLTYAWDLGDSTFALGPVITHTYALPGAYPVVMTATNDCGSWQAVADTLTVTPIPCQEVSIVSVTMDIAGCEVAFGAALTGDPPFTYLWDFGPVGTSTATNPLVHFPSSGVYTGTLSVWNCGSAEPATFAFSVTLACPPKYLIYLPLVVK